MPGTSTDLAPCRHDTGRGAGAAVARFEANVRLVPATIRRLFRQVTPEQFEELEGAGLLGLARAAERYDPARGLPFSSLAVAAVRHAVINRWRSLPEVRAARAGVTFESLDVPAAAAAGSAGGAADGRGGDTALDRLREERQGFDPEGDLLRRDARRRLWEAVEGACAPPQARLLRLLYEEDLSQTEAAERLGVSRQAVSQAHGKALARLRSDARIARLAR